MGQGSTPSDTLQVLSEQGQNRWSTSYVAATAAYATAADDRWLAASAASQRKPRPLLPFSLSRWLPKSLSRWLLQTDLFLVVDTLLQRCWSLASHRSKMLRRWLHHPGRKQCLLLLALQGSVLLCLYQRARRHMAQKARFDIADPTFGPGVIHNMDDPSNLHEAFLDYLHLEKESPIRGHLLQLFRRPDLDEQLGRLYDEASGGAPKLSRDAFTRISRGINGQLHQLLKSKERVPLAACTAEDQRWISEHYDDFFPEERPLDRRLFTGYFKLILMRRIVRTLVARIGLQKLRQGTSAPFVLIVGVDLGAGHPPFRINTVTPNAKKVTCGESLSLIDEAKEEDEFLELSNETHGGFLPALLRSLRRFVKKR